MRFEDSDQPSQIKECFLVFLKGKTRFLITHALYYLEHVDYVYVIDRGKIVEEGEFREIKESEVLKGVLKKFEEDKKFGTEEFELKIEESIGDSFEANSENNEKNSKENFMKNTENKKNFVKNAEKISEENFLKNVENN